MREFRYLPSEFELREVAVGSQLVGYAAVFNSPTVIGGRFREQVMPSAFKKTLRDSDIRALVNHDPNLLLGRNKAGTLRLSTDEHGLHYEIDLPDTQTGRDWHTSIERGDMTQSSFAFEAIRQDLTHPENVEELPTRSLVEVKLFDISAVTYPAYEDTAVQARSVLESLESAGIFINEVPYLRAEESTEAIPEAATETPADAPPAEAPVATSPPEPAPRTFRPYV